jgi:hypothetical protein
MKWRVNLLIEADDEATKQDIEQFLYDLEWVGGCRDPDTDPMFDSVKIIEGSVTRGRQSKESK